MAAAAELPRVLLREGRDWPIRQGHPWVLSGSVERVEGEPEAGAAVCVADRHGEVLGVGDFDPDSQIRVRLCLRDPAEWDPQESWLGARLARALRWRDEHPKLCTTDALRWVNSEGDGLPGLTVDRYAEWRAVKLGTPAMRRRLDAISGHLEELGGGEGAWLRGAGDMDRALFGSVPEGPIEIHEGQRRYLIDLRRGQKTGFYLDQRDARELCAVLAPAKRVLDLFAYTGGFSVAALQGGAQSVTAVESSLPAHELLRLNAPEAECVLGDVGEFLRKDSTRFDLIVIDPPPFSKRKRDVSKATRAYKDLHLRALDRANEGAHLLTFSCSHHIGTELFRKVVRSAAFEAGAELQILDTLQAPVDHPVALTHPEGEYLSGLLLRVARGPRGE